MTYYFFKIIITTFLVIMISEIVRRNEFIGALLASIPFVSILVMFWLYVETGDVSKVNNFSMNVFWLVLPSLVFFVTLPVINRQGMNFYASAGIAGLITIGCYWLMLKVLAYAGIKL